MYIHQIEVQCIAMEVHYAWEVRHYGQVTYNTRMLRHYYLQRLLEKQLQRFNGGEDGLQPPQ